MEDSRRCIIKILPASSTLGWYRGYDGSGCMQLPAGLWLHGHSGYHCGGRVGTLPPLLCWNQTHSFCSTAEFRDRVRRFIAIQSICSRLLSQAGACAQLLGWDESPAGREREGAAQPAQQSLYGNIRKVFDMKGQEGTRLVSL